MAKSVFTLTRRDVQLATEGISPENINRELAQFAKLELAKAIDGGEASPIYDRYVNGRHGAPEESVQAPGPILYVFSYWKPIIEFALDFLRKRSPVLTGKYQGSHVVMVGSQILRPDAEIGAGETVHIVATVPYARKIEVGHMRMSVPDGVYADAGRAVKQRFGGRNGAVIVRNRNIEIPGGYILKGVFTRGYKPGARKKLGKDVAAGTRMTYPALELRMR